MKLDNFFLLPQYIGKGYVKILPLDIFEKIKYLPNNKITLDAEPKVEEFYKKSGFVTIGKLESSIKDRYLLI